MALSRRSFLSGMLAIAATPAIVTSKGFKPAVRGLNSSFFHLDEAPYGFHYAGTVTGRMTSAEPAWQELRLADSRLTRPNERQVAKNILFGERYGTHWEPGDYEQASARRRIFGSPLTKIDFSDLELRVIAERNHRDFFNALKR